MRFSNVRGAKEKRVPSRNIITLLYTTVVFNPMFSYVGTITGTPFEIVPAVCILRKMTSIHEASGVFSVRRKPPNAREVTTITSICCCASS